VFITLFGDKSESGVQFLDNDPKNFQKGRTDIFTIETAELGEITKVRIGHDSKG
jgi:hypothetical protein